MKYKTTYGDLLKEYITDYESTGELFTMDSDSHNFELSEDSKFGHKMNLISFMLRWSLECQHLSSSLPRKMKKRLARLFKLKYTRLQKIINAMEE